MVLYNSDNKKIEERLIELISGITDLDINRVRAAVTEHGVKTVLSNPALISEEAVSKINDLKYILDSMNGEDTDEE